MRKKNLFSSYAFFVYFYVQIKKWDGGIYARLCLLFGDDINSNINEIGKEILLVEIAKTKPMYELMKCVLTEAYPEVGAVPLSNNFIIR